MKRLKELLKKMKEASTAWYSEATSLFKKSFPDVTMDKEYSEEEGVLALMSKKFKGVYKDTPLMISQDRPGKYVAMLYVKSSEASSHKTWDATSLKGLVAKVKADLG